MVEKARYKDPTGLDGAYAAVPSEPPFVFRNVNARIFPIKANMAQLGLFVHQYLNNDIPPDIAHFRPALPFVYLLMLNYGSLEPGSVEARNIGWISQNEIVFSIPLEWWRGDGKGGLVFHDWACTNPFIFVDDNASLTTGREVYGWPKIKAEIHEEAPQWTKNPRNPTRLLNLKTKMFPKLFQGLNEEDLTLLQIYRDPPLSFSQIPLDTRNPWFPVSLMHTAFSGWMGVMGNALEMITGPPFRGYRGGRDPSTLLRMLFKAGRRASRILPNPCQRGLSRLNAEKPEDPEPPKLQLPMITLKQFHQPDEPHEACYQAIIGSDIALDSLNRIGFLGDENLLRGDPSGGFTIRISRYDAQPIVDKLGLEEVSEEEGNEEELKAPVSIFKPTFPFWADTDLYYGKGQVICSRPNFDPEGNIIVPKRKAEDRDRPHAAWMRHPETSYGEGRAYSSTVISSTNTSKKYFNCEKDKEKPEKDKRPLVPYNTVRGGATQPIVGPFTFPDVSLQVYPLKASRKILEDYLDNYLNNTLETLDMRFKLWGSQVYLLVSIYGDKHGKMYSDHNNIGSYIEKEVAFCIPVKWYKDGNFVNWALVSPFLFGNTGRAVISDREINGRPMVKADIESCDDVWLTSSGPTAQRKLLKLDTEIYPGLYLGQKAEDRTLIEIVEGSNKRNPLNNDTDPQKEDQKSKSREAAEKILEKYPITFNRVHLKQHRDAHNTNDLCYQALVKTSRSITDAYDFTPIKQEIKIRIHKYPGRPIADKLGLQKPEKESCGNSAVEIFQAVNPFWLRVPVYEPLGEVVCSRLKDQKWVMFNEALPSLQNHVKKHIEEFFQSSG